MARVWIGLGDSIPEERVVADTRPGEPRPSVASRWTLHSASGDTQPSWFKVRETAVTRSYEGADARDLRLRQLHDDEPLTILRVPIAVGGEAIGSLWAARGRGDPFPGRSHSRLIAAAADQFGQSVLRDRLAAEATAVEVARQGDALKSALLDSVSHDLRTPLAAIRAAAGNLMDPDVALNPEEERAIARSIDLEAQRLSRLVRNMLDLGRIEGGALHPSLELYDLADLVDPVVERVAPALAPSTVEVEMPADLPAVKVDAIFVDQIVTNLLENAGRYAAGKQIRISAKAVGSEVWLNVEDAGPGVAATALPHLFERFYRAPRRQGSRSEGGSGIGLAVVKGLADAMGGSAFARPSTLGGLEVVVRLPVEVEPEVEPAPEGAAEPAPGPKAAEPAPEPAPEPATEPAIDRSGDAVPAAPR
jgi:two-component system sensor histidine kinase KdpD